MKANDFRLGNLVETPYDNGPSAAKKWQVSTIDYHDIAFMYEYADDVKDDYRPIPLTDEWLVKLGFKKNKDKFYAKSIKMGLTLEISSLTQRTIIFNKKRLTFEDIKNIIYVHQLQNLYFALTGEELEVKP